ncbi:MAG: phospholipase D-like domain-containing protein, partial [Peptoniphilus harei]
RNGYEKLITSARKELYIQTPYFVPDEGLLKAIKVAALSGVDVHLMFPAKRDHLFVHWASLSFLGELLKWGAHVYQYEGGFLHTKIVIADDYLSTVGTANFDIRSFELNFEVNAFLYDEELNKKLKEDFKRDLEDCTEITKEIYAKRSRFTKVRESFSRLLSPLL